MLYYVPQYYDKSEERKGVEKEGGRSNSERVMGNRDFLDQPSVYNERKVKEGEGGEEHHQTKEDAQKMGHEQSFTLPVPRGFYRVKRKGWENATTTRTLAPKKKVSESKIKLEKREKKGFDNLGGGPGESGGGCRVTATNRLKRFLT